MNTLLTKTLSIILLISAPLICVKPISETTAKIGAGVGGVVAGAATGVGTYYCAFNDKSNQNIRMVASGLAGLGVGGLTGYLLYQWLCTMTPPGRFAAAEILINSAASDSLIYNQFDTEEALFAHATARFGTSWPLVIARERYMAISHNLERSRSLLNLVYQEAQTDSNYSYLCNQCGPLNQKITDIAKIIEPRINAMTKSMKYDLQIQLYEKHMEAERNRRHEQTLQANKLNHDSAERSKDRNNEAKEREKDRLEKTKDRWHENYKDERKYQHQNNLLNQNQNRPVMLNIG